MKLAEAETVLREAIGIEPDEPAVHDMLGWVFIEQKRFAPAEEAFREAIRLAPELATARRGLASALRNQGNWKEALVAAQDAIRLDPLNRNAHELLGWRSSIWSNSRRPSGRFAKPFGSGRLSPADISAWAKP